MVHLHSLQEILCELSLVLGFHVGLQVDVNDEVATLMADL